MSALVQLLGTATEKASSTSLVITVASLTVTAGNYVSVGVTLDDTNSYIDGNVVDNLGNSYGNAASSEVTGVIKTIYVYNPVTVSGVVTSITITLGAAAVAKGAIAAEFQSSAPRLTTGNFGTSATALGFGSAQDFSANEVLIIIYGVKDDVLPTPGGTTGTPAQTQLSAGSAGTSGGASDSNVSIAMGYIIPTANGTGADPSDANDGSQAWACRGAIFDPFRKFFILH